MIKQLVFLALSICISVSKVSAQDSEKILKIGIGQEFDSLNPLTTSMLASTYIYNMIGRNLVSLDHDLKWHPQLVEELPSFKNKLAEIKTINGVKKIISTWTIRANAKWGDGVDITCEDVKFTQMLGKSNTVTVVNRDQYDQIDAVNCDPKKPKKIELIHKSVRWNFYQLYQYYILPKHLEEPVFTKFGNDKEGYDKNSNYVKNPTNPGLYSGPFVVSELKFGSHILIKRNPQFYGKQPYFDKILVRPISDTAALETNLVSGQIDMVAVVGFNMDQAMTLEKRAEKENFPFRITYTSGFTYEHMDINLINPIFNSKKLRKALLISIDREKMVEALFEGKQKVVGHFLSPRDPWFAKLPEKLKKPMKYDKKEAEKLLDEDGWKMNPDGFRYKDGQKLTFTTYTTASNRLRENVQTFVVDQWKKVGMDVKVKNLPARTFFTEGSHRRLDGPAMFAWTFLPQLSMDKFYHTKSIPSEANGWAGRNYIGFSNKKMDELLDKQESEMDEGKRQKITNQVVEIYVNEHLTLPLYYRVDVTAAPKKLKGYHVTATQQMETLFVENWTY